MLYIQISSFSQDEMQRANIPAEEQVHFPSPGGHSPHHSFRLTLAHTTHYFTDCPLWSSELLTGLHSCLCHCQNINRLRAVILSVWIIEANQWPGTIPGT